MRPVGHHSVLRVFVTWKVVCSIEWLEGARTRRLFQSSIFKAWSVIQFLINSASLAISQVTFNRQLVFATLGVLPDPVS